MMDIETASLRARNKTARVQIAPRSTMLLLARGGSEIRNAGPASCA